MHLLIVCTVVLTVGIFLDRSRVKANGLLFVLKDYVGRIFHWVTLKRVIYTIAILLFVVAAWQAIGFDWAAISLGGDAMLYLEIVSTVYLVALRGRILQIITTVVRAITGTISKSIPSLRSRSRDRRNLRHKSSSGNGNDGDAGPAILAFAFS